MKMEFKKGDTVWVKATVVKAFEGCPGDAPEYVVSLRKDRLADLGYVEICIGVSDVKK